jgi:hypothetical protein
MADSINLVGRRMCEECDAFLGHAHKDTCSKRGRVVENADATEKFTSIEHAEREEPLIGIDRQGAELLVKWLGELDLDDPAEVEKVQAMIDGLTTFIAAAREVEDAPEDPS